MFRSVSVDRRIRAAVTSPSSSLLPTSLIATLQQSQVGLSTSQHRASRDQPHDKTGLLIGQAFPVDISGPLDVEGHQGHSSSGSGLMFETLDGQQVVIPDVDSNSYGISREAYGDIFGPVQNRGTKIDGQAFDNIPIEKVTSLPYNIDGICVYELSFDKERRMASSKDGRNWAPAQTSNRKGFPKGQRKIARCRGSHMCPNKLCSYKHRKRFANQIDFIEGPAGSPVCRYCNSIGEYIACPASKIWEFHEDFVQVKHHGLHTCKAKHPDDLLTMRL